MQPLPRATTCQSEAGGGPLAPSHGAQPNTKGCGKREWGGCRFLDFLRFLQLLLQAFLLRISQFFQY